MGNKFLSDEYLQQLKDRVEYLEYVRSQLNPDIAEECVKAAEFALKHNVPRKILGKTSAEKHMTEVDEELIKLKREIRYLDHYLKGEYEE